MCWQITNMVSKSLGYQPINLTEPSENLILAPSSNRSRTTWILLRHFCACELLVWGKTYKLFEQFKPMRAGGKYVAASVLLEVPHGLKPQPSFSLWSLTPLYLVYLVRHTVHRPPCRAYQ